MADGSGVLRMAKKQKKDEPPQLKPAPKKQQCGATHDGYTCTKEKGHFFSHVDVASGEGWNEDSLSA